MTNNPILYIPGWTYIRWAIYPTNKHDTCGYTAACLLLNYYNNLPGPLQGKMIPKDFFGPNGKLKTTGYTLQDKLIQYTSVSKSWAWSVAKVLNLYFKENEIPAKAHFSFFRLGAIRKVKGGTPVILFGNLPDGETRLNHAVTAFGLKKEEGLFPNFVVHYGWRGKGFCVLKDAIIGSYCYIKGEG